MQLSRLPLVALLVIGLLTACSNSHDDDTPPPTEAQQLQAQFGEGLAAFSEEGMQALLDYEDASSPVTLLQLMTVTDVEGFNTYENAVAAVWQTYGAQTVFASQIIAQMIGERSFVEVRAIEFPNITMLLDAFYSGEFKAAMDTLFAATEDHAWVLGKQLPLPIKPEGGYFDPALMGKNREDAMAILAAAGAGDNNRGNSSSGNPEAIIDMVVSDSPEAFHMVNLIDFYEQANYADGRETDLTGEEANAIYGNAITPILLQFNSFPALAMPIDIVLTEDTIEWEQAAIVRYASRDAFLNAFVLNPSSNDALIHKDAGVENTLVYVSEQRHAEPPSPQGGILFNQRYCEVLLADIQASEVIAEVWATQGLDACQQADWEALDADAIAADRGVDLAFLNGPRFLVTDWNANTEGLTDNGITTFFGAIEMHLRTTVRVPLGGGGLQEYYRVAEVSRGNTWHYVAGRRVYELTDPEGNRYMMQAYSRIVNPNLALEDLATLGDQLSLPEGWSFSSRVLTNSFALPAVDGIARVVQDNLANTYQLVPQG